MPRRPKPTVLKVLEGNPGKRPLPLQEPQPQGDCPNAPVHLDAYALEEWERISTGLHRLGLLTEVDMTVFAAYCTAWSRFRHAEEAMQAQGNNLVVEPERKLPRANPLIGIANEASKMMLTIASEFGLTPSARARLGVRPQSGKKSKFDGLIGG